MAWAEKARTSLRAALVGFIRHQRAFGLVTVCAENVRTSIDKMDEKRQNVFMSPKDNPDARKPRALAPAAGTKQALILSAATQAFLTYGFRRTSMEEIARRAGMSRAALYLHYKNKEDIYASLVAQFYDEAAEGFAQGLAAGSTPTDALLRGFQAKLSPAFRAISGSAHAAELLDVSGTIGGQVVADGETILHDVLASWLAQEDAAGRIALTRLGADASETARLFLSAAHGVKSGVADMAEAEARLMQLARAFGHALTP